MKTFACLRIGFVCLSVLLALGAPAFAVANPPGWFIEADGRSVDASGVVSGFTLDDDDSGASIIGGFAFNRYFSLQVGYHDMGSHFATDCPPPLLCIVSNVDEVDVTGWSAAATLTWPLAERFELFGTIGVMDWDADFSRFRDRDDSSTDLLYGAGAAWWPSQNWRISLAYEEVDFDLESVKLGLRYQF
jgi:opacity protein-like surface antigen